MIIAFCPDVPNHSLAATVVYLNLLKTNTKKWTSFYQKKHGSFKSGYSYFIIKSLNYLDHFGCRGTTVETADVWKGQCRKG